MTSSVSPQPASGPNESISFGKKLLTDLQNKVSEFTPNIPYAAGTFVMLSGLGIDHYTAACLGIIVGWFNKQPIK